MRSCLGRWAGYQACRRRRPAADTDEVPPLPGRLLVLVAVVVPEEEVASQEARGLPWTAVWMLLMAGCATVVITVSSKACSTWIHPIIAMDVTCFMIK